MSIEINQMSGEKEVSEMNETLPPTRGEPFDTSLSQINKSSPTQNKLMKKGTPIKINGGQVYLKEINK